VDRGKGRAFDCEWYQSGPGDVSHVQVRALRGSSTEKGELQGSATLVLKLKCWLSSHSLTGRKVGGQFAELDENFKMTITCQPLHPVRFPYNSGRCGIEHLRDKCFPPVMFTLSKSLTNSGMELFKGGHIHLCRMLLEYLGAMKLRQ
jgi:hypothetical protein